MYLKKLLTLIIALFFGTLTAVAGTSIMAPWLTVDGGVGSGAIYGLAIDGTNAYAQLGLNNLVQIIFMHFLAYAKEPEPKLKLASEICLPPPLVFCKCLIIKYPPLTTPNRCYRRVPG